MSDCSSRSSVSRSLFGPTDPQENMRLAYEEINNTRSSDQKNWNFDFKRGKPFSGRFEWKKVNDNQKNNFVQKGEK